MNVPNTRIRRRQPRNVVVPPLVCALLALSGSAAVNAQCIDYSSDPAGCQPSTFDTPIGEMPSVRVDGLGRIDAFSSAEQARTGFARLEKELHLFRNFEHLHWVITVPSERDDGTGAWRGGDLDGAGDARGMGIAGGCIFVGHRNGPGVIREIDIFRIQSDPATMPPVKVGELPAMSLGNEGFDDRELRALVYADANGEDRMLLARNAGTRTIGRMETFEIDMESCLPLRKSEVHDFAGPSHEFFLWHDPANSSRVLVYVAMFAGGGLPDPENPSLRIPDAIVLAVTDEETGEVLDRPRVLAGFSLQEVGGPPINERPDATGLFADGRFADFSDSSNRSDQPGNFQNRQNNMLHSLSVTNDGERVYVAGGNAGFYVLNSEAIASHTDADLIAGTAECNQRSTIVSVNGVIDAARLSTLADDCLHMVVSDDPGLQAFLDSAAPADAKAARYLVLLTRSRVDVHPPNNSLPTGIHSAVFVPDRPARVRGNDRSRPAFVWLTDENFGCPLMHARIVSVEVEATPTMIGAFAIPDNEIGECLDQANAEPNGEPRRRVSQQNHNPTVFKNLVFNSWYGHGIRAIDISNPYMPREVGHAVTVPHGVARTYPVFKDGLIYWADSDTGLHVGRYTGPRSDELPGPGSGTYESNATSPHR
ncbi:MAG: hypothetical protein V3R59_04325 [Gammaproteobacteria bacterium]